MFIRSHTSTLNQIFCELLLNTQVIFKSMRVADDTFWWNSDCEWVNTEFRPTDQVISKAIVECLLLCAFVLSCLKGDSMSWLGQREQINTAMDRI